MITLNNNGFEQSWPCLWGIAQSSLGASWYLPLLLLGTPCSRSSCFKEKIITHSIIVQCHITQCRISKVKLEWSIHPSADYIPLVSEISIISLLCSVFFHWPWKLWLHLNSVMGNTFWWMFDDEQKTEVAWIKPTSKTTQIKRYWLGQITTNLLALMTHRWSISLMN